MTVQVCRVLPAGEPPSAQVIERFRKLPSSLVSDSQERSGGLVGIYQVGGSRDSPMVGPALTVRTAEGDNLVVHKALELCQPGQIVVIDGAGYQGRALIGEIMVKYAESRGIAGFVVDGAVRDSSSLQQGRVPVFARAVCHLGPFKDGPGEIHGTIAIAGCVINDGDILVGDGDGVAVVAASRVDEVATFAERKAEDEKRWLADIEAGTYDPSWIDERLDRR